MKLKNKDQIKIFFPSNSEPVRCGQPPTLAWLELWEAAMEKASATIFEANKMHLQKDCFDSVTEEESKVPCLNSFICGCNLLNRKGWAGRRR